MKAFLGIDTSNYTTSTALLFEDGSIKQEKMPLPVAKNNIGLRQNEAVFLHVKQLGDLLEKLLLDNDQVICAVGAASCPRDEAGSYMPCFLSGEMSAKSVASALKIPLFTFSHQAGHIAAALYDARKTQLFSNEFLAFHVSGGTTQCLHVTPDEFEKTQFKITTIAQSLDLHAGQLVDRVGAMLGLGFPAGPELEKLAEMSDKNDCLKIVFKGCDCCLSGVENRCADMIDKSIDPCDVARYCILSIENAVLGMTKRVLEKYPGLELVYAGGVMSNRIIKKGVQRVYNASFASPAFSADNAAGIAVLCRRMYQRGQSAE